MALISLIMVSYSRASPILLVRQISSQKQVFLLRLEIQTVSYYCNLNLNFENLNFENFLTDRCYLVLDCILSQMSLSLLQQSFANFDCLSFCRAKGALRCILDRCFYDGFLMILIRSSVMLITLNHTRILPCLAVAMCFA